MQKDKCLTMANNNRTGDYKSSFHNKCLVCPHCLRVKTHVKKESPDGRFEPLTSKDEQGNYLVYKGFCIQPTCNSLEEAKKLLLKEPDAENFPPIFASDGQRSTDHEFREYTIEHGLCYICGRIQTHSVTEDDLVSVPLTIGKPGAFAVYKGYCLSEHCHSLERVKELLGEDVLTSSNKSRKSEHHIKSPFVANEASMSSTTNQNDGDKNSSQHEKRNAFERFSKWCSTKKTRPVSQVNTLNHDSPKSPRPVLSTTRASPSRADSKVRISVEREFKPQNRPTICRSFSQGAEKKPRQKKKKKGVKPRRAYSEEEKRNKSTESRSVSFHTKQSNGNPKQRKDAQDISQENSTIDKSSSHGSERKEIGARRGVGRSYSDGSKSTYRRREKRSSLPLGMSVSFDSRTNKIYDKKNRDANRRIVGRVSSNKRRISQPRSSSSFRKVPSSVRVNKSKSSFASSRHMKDTMEKGSDHTNRSIENGSDHTNRSIEKGSDHKTRSVAPKHQNAMVEALEKIVGEEFNLRLLLLAAELESGGDLVCLPAILDVEKVLQRLVRENEDEGLNIQARAGMATGKRVRRLLSRQSLQVLNKDQVIAIEEFVSAVNEIQISLEQQLITDDDDPDHQGTVNSLRRSAQSLREHLRKPRSNENSDSADHILEKTQTRCQSSINEDSNISDMTSTADHTTIEDVHASSDSFACDTLPTVPVRASSPSQELDEKESSDFQADSAMQQEACDVQKVSPAVEQNNFDRLVVFQSAPLGYINLGTNESSTLPVPLLDFEHEARVLEQSLKDAENTGARIEIEFDTATTDRFSNFFAQGGSRVMHLSCHGHPGYLALETGCGDMQALPVAELKRFIATGGGNLEVVFVSACYSRRAGDAFLDAGVKHVVCCRQDEKFRDLGAVEFAKNFYRALACRKNLREAFQLSKEAVRVSPLVKDSQFESDKFLLLPEKPKDDPYHDVPVFFTQPVPTRSVNMTSSQDVLRHIPRTPQYFIGRELVMYDIVKSLSYADVVRVVGPSGVGKASVVAAVARYIVQRRKSFDIDDLFWLHPLKEGLHVTESVHSTLCKVIDLLERSNDDTIFGDSAYNDFWAGPINELHGKRVILVIDGRRFKSEAARQNLERFLRELLHLANVRVIMICPEDYNGKKSTHSRRDETINIGPLESKSSALLYGNLSQHISKQRCPMARTPEEFACLMVPPSDAIEHEPDTILSRRYAELSRRIGNGNPAAIKRAASDMTETQFGELIRIARRPKVTLDSRSALENEISRRKVQMKKALGKMEFFRARDLQEIVQELESFRPSFPGLHELNAQEATLQNQLEKCVDSRQYELAGKIQLEIDLVKSRILKEMLSAGAAQPAKANLRGSAAELDTHRSSFIKPEENRTQVVLQAQLEKYIASNPFELDDEVQHKIQRENSSISDGAHSPAQLPVAPV